ncbi:hypothetical protein [Eubacterium sp. ER2]|uniref:hypothetical protein n=1 Tax=Eubacterium sp. ER2 TaxID=1519438 RepID=UPI00051B493A|nr:hypothetical protein [Eubacterium sp. ER2]
MAKKKSSQYTVTAALKYLQNEVLQITGYTKTMYQYKALDYFLSGDRKIDDRLKITARTNPLYVHRDVRDQIYLDPVQHQEIKKVAEAEGVKISVVLFQAVLNYTCIQANLLGITGRIINNDNK